MIPLDIGVKGSAVFLYFVSLCCRSYLDGRYGPLPEKGMNTLKQAVLCGESLSCGKLPVP